MDWLYAKSADSPPGQGRTHIFLSLEFFHMFLSTKAKNFTFMPISCGRALVCSPPRGMYIVLSKTTTFLPRRPLNQKKIFVVKSIAPHLT